MGKTRDVTYVGKGKTTLDPLVDEYDMIAIDACRPSSWSTAAAPPP